MQITDILSNTSGLQSIAQTLGVSDDVVATRVRQLRT
jgi:biotin operon repressor